MFNWFRRKPKKQEKRNYAASDMFIHMLKTPIYTDFTVNKATREGYAVNGWVYRSVFAISKAVSSVPFYIGTDADVWVNHPLNTVFAKPNPHFSRSDMFELISMWLLLTGNSYLKKTRAGKRTVELWPISPDRIHPIPASRVDEFISGYAVDASTKKAFEPEEIIHHKFINPANPFIGIGPLQVGGKAVDADISQQDFNVVTSQNRGVVDGVFSFKREFDSQEATDEISAAIQEKYGRKRGFVVLGGDANYIRTAMTPVEMDFQSSRKFNREEIFIIFGVPPQLVGAQESSTYNNYQTSERIFWNSTVIPLLKDLAETFTMALQDEIGEEFRVCYDLSGIPACQHGINEKADSAKKFWDMGVPFDKLNDHFGLGIEAYEGWDKPFGGGKANTEFPNQNLRECREAGEDINIKEAYRLKLAALMDRAVSENKPEIIRISENMKDAVADMIRSGNTEADVKRVIGMFSDPYKMTFNAVFWDASYGVYSLRGDIENAIDEYLDTEKYLLTELARMEDGAAGAILELVRKGLDEGKDVQAIMFMFEESMICDPERALRLARTIAGTAGSVANHAYNATQGAQTKTWLASMINTRPAHMGRHGQTRKLHERFSPAFGMATGPMYPMDPVLVPADRVNCRCALDYS